MSSLRRELVTAIRRPADLLNPLVFFVMVTSLFPLGVSPSGETLRSIAPGVIWVAGLLATLMAMESLFRSDFDDGSLEQVAVSRQPLVWVALGKVLGQWCLSGFLLVLASPVIGLMFALEARAAFVLLLSLLVGTPTLALVGSIGAALTVGLRKGGVLLAVLILPLYIPVLIMGTEMVKAGIGGAPITGHLLWLLAMLAAALGLAPVATAAGLRVSLQT
ncbi:MAG: heme exporter protein CcmB [Gammaproteobacteria bacterium]|nr:heme exporter protein CcmB [Gammaproteobacteria bacterium]